MIGGELIGSLDGLLDQFRRWREGPDVEALAAEVKQIVIDGNTRGLLAGLDCNGVPFAPLKPATYERGREGLGPELVPRFSASQLIDRLRVEVTKTGPNELRVVASWPGVEQVRFFVTRTANMARRDPVGIRPEDRQRIEQAARKYAVEFLGIV